MGWTSFSMNEPVKEWFKNLWNYENSDYEVIDSALVQRQSLYGAVRKKSTGDVFCAVFLIRWSRSDYNFSYKDMTEHAGPNVVNCPLRIMKLLTPLNDENDPNGWASSWRQRVEEYHKNREKLKKGGIIKTKNPVEFTSGMSYQYFKKEGRTLWGGMLDERGCFSALSRVRVNLSNYDYEILEKVLVVS